MWRIDIQVAKWERYYMVTESTICEGRENTIIRTMKNTRSKIGVIVCKG